MPLEEGMYGLTSPVIKVDEIPKPTMRQTVLFRAPIWVLGKAMSPFRKSKDHLRVDSESSEVDSDEATPKANNGNARRRAKKGSQAS